MRVAVWIAAVSCLAQLLGVCLSVYTMDRHGRRLTALRSAAAVTISLLLLSSCFYLTNPDDLGDGLTLKQRLSVASHDKLFTHLYRAEPPGGPSEMPNRIGQCVASCKALAASGVGRDGGHAEALGSDGPWAKGLGEGSGRRVRGARGVRRPGSRRGRGALDWDTWA